MRKKIVFSIFATKFEFVSLLRRTLKLLHRIVEQRKSHIRITIIWRLISMSLAQKRARIRLPQASSKRYNSHSQLQLSAPTAAPAYSSGLLHPMLFLLGVAPNHIIKQILQEDKWKNTWMKALEVEKLAPYRSLPSFTKRVSGGVLPDFRTRCSMHILLELCKSFLLVYFASYPIPCIEGWKAGSSSAIFGRSKKKIMLLLINSIWQTVVVTTRA